MVAHQALGMYLPAGFQARLGQGLQKTLPVLVVLEDVLPPVTTVQYVIHRAGILNAQLPSHGRRIIILSGSVNAKLLQYS